MTPERAKKLLPVIKAFAEGKQIQVKELNDTQWGDCINPRFYDNLDYRVKPEPKYGWIILSPNKRSKSGYSVYPSVFTTEKQAKEATHVSDGEKVMKIRLDEADGEE